MGVGGPSFQDKGFPRSENRDRGIPGSYPAAHQETGRESGEKRLLRKLSEMLPELHAEELSSGCEAEPDSSVTTTYASPPGAEEPCRVRESKTKCTSARREDGTILIPERPPQR